MKNTVKVAIAAFLCATLAVAGCKPAAVNTEKTKDYIGTETIGQSQVKVYGTGATGDYKSVAFEETNSLCADNEGMGWVVLEEPLLGGLPSLGYKGTLPEVKCVSLSTAWSTVEKTPGVYDWTVMDETIAYWASLGKTINMRLCTDSQNLNQDVVYGCPSWLFEAPYNVPMVINSGNIYADLSNAAYQENLEKFLKEFAAHYSDKDYAYRDAIEVVELRGYGMVGEWHSGWNTYNSVEERIEALRSVIRLWREAWADKLLVISCTYEFLNNMWGVANADNYADFMRFMGYDYALENNITFRRDGIAFALQQFDSRMALDYFYDNTGLPLLGEIGDGYAKHGDESAYPLFEAMNEGLMKWRVNYMTVIGWVAQDFGVVIDNETELVEYFNRNMGYRLVPDKIDYSTKVSAGGKFYMDSVWTNKAMGRCWKDYDLSVYFEDSTGRTVYAGTDASFNPVSINGGEPHFFDLEYKLPSDLAKGEYTVKFAITDKDGNPKIEMPIAGGNSKKYYLGKVTVGDTAAQDKRSADNIDENTSFSAVGTGKITSRTTNVDGSKALVGSGDGVFAKGAALENGKTYYVTFDYKTAKAKTDIDIQDDSLYYCGAYADGYGDEYHWLDVSNQVSHRTVTLKVPADGKKYYLAFGCKSGASEIAIDNVYVEKAESLDASFRINKNFTETKDDGSYVISSQLTQNWAEGLQLKNRLKPHTAYMLTFDARTVTEISGGGFFYASLTNSKDDWDEKYSSIKAFTEGKIGSFWTPVDYDYMKYSYVFNTEDYDDDSQLVFGVRNMGGVQIKNITVTEVSSDYAYAADDEVIKHNVVPNKNIKVDEKGVVENFEAGVFNGGCMRPGDRNTGIITRDKNLVISGDYSCWVSNTREGADVFTFNVFCQTNPADFYFSGNTSYRVRFKFKVVEDVRKSENGYFYCLAREEGTFLHDVGIYEMREGYEVGKVYSVEYEFTTGKSDKYYFMWGIYKYGAIVIDDVTFEKIDSAQSGVKLTAGSAYEITQDVLYSR